MRGAWRGPWERPYCGAKPGVKNHFRWRSFLLARGGTASGGVRRQAKQPAFGWKIATGEIVWSDETCRIFQYDPSLTPALDLVLQRCHPDDVAYVRRAIERAALGGDAFDLEHRPLMPDGSVRHLRVVSNGFRDDAGDLEYVGAVMDVSEQHRANAALQRANLELSRTEDHLRLVIDTIPSMVWSARPDGSMEFQSASWQAYHGRSVDELERGGWLSIVHPDELGNGEIWANAVATGGPYEIELRIRS